MKIENIYIILNLMILRKELLQLIIQFMKYMLMNCVVDFIMISLQYDILDKLI